MTDHNKKVFTRKIHYKLGEGKEEYLGTFNDSDKEVEDVKEHHSRIRKGLGL